MACVWMSLLLFAAMSLGPLCYIDQSQQGRKAKLKVSCKVSGGLSGGRRQSIVEAGRRSSFSWLYAGPCVLGRSEQRGRNMRWSFKMLVESLKSLMKCCARRLECLFKDASSLLSMVMVPPICLMDSQQVTKKRTRSGRLIHFEY